jgi:hypothetical protein
MVGRSRKSFSASAGPVDADAFEGLDEGALGKKAALLEEAMLESNNRWEKERNQRSGAKRSRSQVGLGNGWWTSPPQYFFQQVCFHIA